MDKTNIDKTKSYINFKIGEEHFAISVFRVLEILQLEELTRIPNSSDFVLGVINFRGSIVPVIDMHKRFNIIVPEAGNRMIIIVDVTNMQKSVLMGLFVDEVTDVIEFDYKSIRAVPDLGIKYNPEFLEGFVENKDKFVMVLDTDRVFSVSELAETSMISSVG